MNDINDAIVTPARVAKALRFNTDGVERLATFVYSASTDPWRVFEGCQQQRVMGLAARSLDECRNRYIEDRGARVEVIKQMLEVKS